VLQQELKKKIQKESRMKRYIAGLRKGIGNSGEPKEEELEDISNPLANTLFSLNLESFAESNKGEFLVFVIQFIFTVLVQKLDFLENLYSDLKLKVQESIPENSGSYEELKEALSSASQEIKRTMKDISKTVSTSLSERGGPVEQTDSSTEITMANSQRGSTVQRETISREVMTVDAEFRFHVPKIFQQYFRNHSLSPQLLQEAFVCKMITHIYVQAISSRYNKSLHSVIFEVFVQIFGSQYWIERVLGDKFNDLGNT
jgi:hypothetical protein